MILPGPAVVSLFLVPCPLSLLPCPFSLVPSHLSLFPRFVPWSNPRMAKKKTVKRRKKVAPKSVGLAPADITAPDDPEIARLTGQVQSDGGAVLTAYREPFGGTTVLLAALPIDRVEPTPFQRDPSLPHVKRLMNVIETLGRFLDPIVAIRQDDAYWTPNGNHRLQAMRKLGAKSVIALVVTDPDVAFKILALNTEKAHNLKEKS